MRHSDYCVSTVSAELGPTPGRHGNIGGPVACFHNQIGAFIEVDLTRDDDLVSRLVGNWRLRIDDEPPNRQVDRAQAGPRIVADDAMIALAKKVAGRARCETLTAAGQRKRQIVEDTPLFRKE